jgi:hypothetical protein
VLSLFELKSRNPRRPKETAQPFPPPFTKAWHLTESDSSRLFVITSEDLILAIDNLPMQNEGRFPEFKRSYIFDRLMAKTRPTPGGDNWSGHSDGSVLLTLSSHKHQRIHEREVDALSIALSTSLFEKLA